VAQALSDLSLGLKYGKTGEQALKAAGVRLDKRRRKPATTPLKRRVRTSARKPRKRSARTRYFARFWHVAAGFVEAFAPVVWAATETKLRRQAEEIRASGRPLVWLLDEIPVLRIDESGKRKKSEGYSLLVLAELDWTDKAVPGATKLRVIRAMPKGNTVAWRLVFDEVGYIPDIIVSDAATSIISAVTTHFGTPGPLFVPSVWHMGKALANNALKLALLGECGGQIRSHLGKLGSDGSALTSVAEWHTWWDILMGLADASGQVKLDDLTKSRAHYEERMATALPTLLADPQLLRSTGGLESIIQSSIEPVLEGRRFQLANIERTNNLFDLVVCRQHDAFVEPGDIAALIEADEIPWGGWTVPLRAIADARPRRGQYSSLRDESLMMAAAEERGLL
jgi:hypothetical protein